jgi:glycosyltransferase involved in cell wall biosynthesis
MVPPLISVVIPVFNTEKYLSACLNSVLHQLLDSIEIILIDDCSPDQSIEVIKHFIAADHRIKLIRHEENLGLGGARNTGISNAQGKYISFLDSDDILPVDALFELYQLAQRNDADMVIGNMAVITGNHLFPVEYIDERITNWDIFPDPNRRTLPQRHYYSGNATNRLYRSSLLLENDIKFPHHLYFEDMSFSVESWYFSKVICSTPKFVIFRTIRNDPHNPSITQTFNKKAFSDRDEIVKRIHQFAITHPGAKDFAVETLFRILYTSEEMVISANTQCVNEIRERWYPNHFLEVNRMIRSLSIKK